MQSYATLILQNPELLALIRDRFGDTVYTDDNEICEAATTVGYLSTENGICNLHLPCGRIIDKYIIT